MIIRVLGIETSCDETGIAIYDYNKGLLSNQIFSQSKIHAKYGGVVPELTSKYHLNKTVFLIKKALFFAKLKISEIHGIAYTSGPGLVNALLIGATIGRSLAYSRNIPAIAINHIEGHLLIPMIEKNPPTFPFVALLISGGHTQLISVTNFGRYKLLGNSIDDAVGEAFDKTARLLGLKYPGGSLLSNLAKYGISGRYIFPRPMTNKPGLSFSFSGLKTFVANIIRKTSNNYQTKADIAKAFEEAIIETLIIKCKRALDITGFKNLVITGGVSSNKSIRNSLSKMMINRGGKAFYARHEFCTDNGAMIAYVGMLRLNQGYRSNLKIKVKPFWKIDNI